MVHNFETLTLNAARLTQTAQIFGIPIISTKQINGGKIADEITKHHFEGVKQWEKKTFSMINSDTLPYLESIKKQNVVIYGAEAHICML